MTHPFVRKLRNGSHLSSEDEAILADLPQPSRTVPARRDLLTEGGEPRSLPLIVEGWACRYRLIENGKRQITSLLLPGDLCEPFGALPRAMDTAIGTLTTAVVAFVPVQSAKAAASVNARVDAALWWDLLVASAIEREHIVSLGRRSASERLGHLLCELQLRLQWVDLASDGAFDLPLTQVDISDLLGLSSVHENRSLQELRRSGLLSFTERRVTIHDVGELQELSFFDPSYLQLSAETFRLHR